MISHLDTIYLYNDEGPVYDKIDNLYMTHVHFDVWCIHFSLKQFFSTTIYSVAKICWNFWNREAHPRKNLRVGLSPP